MAIERISLPELDDEYAFDYDTVAITKLHSALLGDVLASPALEIQDRNKLLGSALRSHRELRERGEFEAAAQYDSIIETIPS